MRLYAVFFLLVTSGSAAALAKQADLIYAYRNQQALKLDLYVPDSPPSSTGYPLIISFHGGGWALGNKHNDLFLKTLVDRGYALASVDYRLSGRAPFPAQIEDAREATRWLLHHASILHLDPRRFAATGISAGGHLALLLAFSEGHRFSSSAPALPPAHTIKAVIAFYAPSDLIGIVPPKKRDERTNLVARFLGGPVSQRLSLAREASPIAYVRPGLPPVLLIHGNRDHVVPLDQSLGLAQALRKRHVQTGLIIYSGRGHAFRPSPQTIGAMEAFLKAHLTPTPE